jgi:hypothetical protein
LTILPTNLVCPWLLHSRRNKFDPDGINSQLAGSLSSTNVEVTLNWHPISAVKRATSASRCMAATPSLPHDAWERKDGYA